MPYSSVKWHLSRGLDSSRELKVLSQAKLIWICCIFVKPAIKLKMVGGRILFQRLISECSFCVFNYPRNSYFFYEFHVVGLKIVGTPPPLNVVNFVKRVRRGPLNTTLQETQTFSINNWLFKKIYIQRRKLSYMYKVGMAGG